MLDLPVLFSALPLAALKPTATGPADAAGAPMAPGAAPVTVAGAPATGPATGASTDALSSTTATTQQNGGEAPVPKTNPYANVMQIALIGGMFVLLYFVMFRPQKKAEKDRKALISAMKKGDRVMTIGGLVARVHSIDDDDVVLKIDESANVKATFKKTSIQQILDRDDKSK